LWVQHPQNEAPESVKIKMTNRFITSPFSLTVLVDGRIAFLSSPTPAPLADEMPRVVIAPSHQTAVRVMAAAVFPANSFVGDGARRALKMRWVVSAIPSKTTVRVMAAARSTANGSKIDSVHSVTADASCESKTSEDRNHDPSHGKALLLV